MKNLLLLLKIDFLANFNFGRKKSNTSQLKRYLLLIAGLILFTVIYGNMFIGMGQDFNIASYTFIALYFLLGFMTFTSTIYRAKTVLFELKDELLVMPIKPSIIFLSKLLSITIYNTVISGIIFITYSVCYMLALSMPLTFIILPIILSLFIAIIPTILGALIGYILGVIFAKLKIKKGVETVVSLLGLLALLYFNVQFNSYITYLSTNNAQVVQSILEFLNGIGMFINLLYESIFSYNIISMLIFIAINIISIALYILIFHKSFIKLNQLMKFEKVKGKYKYKKEKSTSLKLALIKREYRNYMSIPIYVVNTIIGPLMLLIVAVGVNFYDVSEFTKMGTDVLYIYTLAALCFLVSTATTTSSSISLEGKNLWILRSLPIKTKDILMSKYLFNTILTIPVAIITILSVGINVGFNLYQIVMLILISTIVTKCIIMIGLLNNLSYPKLDYTNPVEVVKQSMPVMFTALTSMAIAGSVIFLYFALGAFLTNYLFLLDIGICIIGSITLFVLYKKLCTIGVKKFEQLS